MPDYFVPLDTLKYSKCYRELFNKNLITNASLKYMDKNRKILSKQYSSFEEFKSTFQVPQEMIDGIFAEGEKQNIKPKDDEDKAKAIENMRKILKGYIARDLWDMSEYFSIIYEDDEVVKKAVELLEK
jgi:carboxyl-terminal processing protease